MDIIAYYFLRTYSASLCCVCRVNKPYLPIAAGDLSVKSAWLLVVFFVVTGLLIVGMNFGPFITSLYSLGLFLGTMYSVPPFRMKRFPVAAFLIIATVSLFFSCYLILTIEVCAHFLVIYFFLHSKVSNYSNCLIFFIHGI